MRGDGKAKVKSILKTLFITPKEDIYRFAKVTLLLFICSIAYDIGISYSVFKYLPTFFMSNEANPITRAIFGGNTLAMVISIFLHIFIIVIVLCVCKAYSKNSNVKKERNLMIAANVYVFILVTGAFLHFIGGTTWLV
jgi:hypothetical protein